MVSALQCIGAEQASASTACTLQASCRDGPPVSGPGIYIPPAVTAVSPASPAVLSVLAPLPSPGWRLLARPLQTRCSLDPRLQRPGPGPLGCCRHWVADTVSD